MQKIRKTRINERKERKEKEMRDKKGISLVVLVITIIVMIVLASAVIISLSEAGIIGKANQAVKLSNKQEIETFVQLMWSEEYMDTDGKINRTRLEEKIKAKLTEQGVNLDQYEIDVTNKGVSLKEFDRTNWEFAYTYTSSSDLWSTKKTKADGELTGDIIVKFYKTGLPVDPPEETIAEYLLYALGVPVPVSFPEGDAYKMTIEGTGNMGMLMTTDMTVANAWQQETVAYIMGQLGEGKVPVIPYVTEIEIGDGITNISHNAFTGASSLTTVKGGKKIEEIEANAFGFAENLIDITMPASLKKIGDNAFANSNKLTNIHVESLEAWNNTIALSPTNSLQLIDAKVTYDYRTEVERLANEGWRKAYNAGNKTANKLQTAVNTYLTENNVSANELALYNITATTSGVEITAKETTLGSIITSGLDYGKTINYSANGINNWQVLYKKRVNGVEYVYLLASENAPNSSLPNLPGATKNGKSIYWNSAPTTQANIERPTLWMAEWEDDDHKYITYANGIAVSYFLDEQYWKSFKNTKYGDNVVGAIGTPTAEMLTASYNERSIALGDTADNSTLTLTKDTYGYMINENYHVNLSRIEKLYTGSPKLKEHTWLASPSNSSADDLTLDFDGYVYGCNYDDTRLGVRPLVCLKSSIPAYVGLSANGTDIILK